MNTDPDNPDTPDPSDPSDLNGALDTLQAFGRSERGKGSATTSEYQTGTVPLAQVVPSKTNPRKSFEGPEFDELVASVELHGILQPVLVRPRELTEADVDVWKANFHTIAQGDCYILGNGYELVCGERRYRAAIQAGLTEIPVAIRSLRDEEVLTLQIVENLQRKDVSALEEAGGYKTLLDTMFAAQGGELLSDDGARRTGRKTREEMVAEIATQIGKSTRYVWARMKLDQLIPPIKQALAEGKIEASHGDELARLSEKQQSKVFLDMFCEGLAWEQEKAREAHPDKEPEYKLYAPADMPSVRDLKARLKRDGKELQRAPWKLKHDTLAPACGPCEFNTANQEGGDPKKPMCINMGCYEDKAKRTIDVQVNELLAAQPFGAELVKVSKSSYSTPKGVLKAEQWVKAAKGSCDFVAGVAVVGHDGETEAVATACTNKSCKVHFAKGSAAESPAEKARIAKERAEKALRKHEQDLRNRTLTAFLGTVTKLTPETLRTLATWYAGEERCDGDAQELISASCGKPVMDVVKKSAVDSPEFAKAVVGIFAARELEVRSWGKPEDGRDEFHAVIDSLGGSGKKLRAAVELNLSQKPTKQDPTSEQLAALAPVKKSAGKSTSADRISKSFGKALARGEAKAKKAKKTPAKKVAGKKGGRA